MQAAKQLAINDTGMLVPALIGDTAVRDGELVKAIMDIPALVAGIVNVDVSPDGGGTWHSLGADMFDRQGFPTPAAYVGGQRLVFGPLVPGTRIRVRSAAGQVATVTVLFGL